MEATVDQSQAALRNAADQVVDDVRSGAGHMRAAGVAELQNLIEDVEELLKHVANLKDAELVRMRDRIANTLAAAKESVVAATASIKAQAYRVASSADDYVTDSPWRALGIAALFGMIVGLLAARRP
jgi:ElaB/YqjD/DUF883 family membrane-anchored ribosome-binding protein